MIETTHYHCGASATGEGPLPLGCPEHARELDCIKALVKEASEIMQITYAGNFPAGIESFLSRAHLVLHRANCASSQSSKWSPEAFDLQLTDDAERLLENLATGDGEHSAALDVGLVKAAFRHLMIWADGFKAVELLTEKYQNMGCRIIYDSRNEMAAMYCSTSDCAFGPLFYAEGEHDAKERAEAFMRWLANTAKLSDYEQDVLSRGMGDPRELTEASLLRAYYDWSTQEAKQYERETPPICEECGEPVGTCDSDCPCSTAEAPFCPSCSREKAGK